MASTTKTQLAQAIQFLRKNQRGKSLEILGAISEHDLKQTEDIFNYAQLCQELGQVGVAITKLSILTEKQPENIVFLSALASAYLANHQLHEAELTLIKCLRLDPDNAKSLGLLASIYIKTEHYELAANRLEKAIALEPGNATHHANLCLVLIETGQHEKALEHALIAEKRGPKNANIYHAIGRIHLELGDIELAVKNFLRAIKINPTSGTTYNSLSKAKKFSHDDIAIIQNAEKALSQSMPVIEKYHLYFALGKMHDDLKNWSHAFQYYQQGNRLAKTAYAPPLPKAYIQQQVKLIKSRHYPALKAAGHPSAKPIFIVGMPRSGSTLIEQMISSHPQAYGAGELYEMIDISQLLLMENAAKGLKPRKLSSITPQELTNLAKKYLCALEEKSSDAIRITDKMPGNYNLIACITTLFPNATIIHTTRHPLDTCLSCYFQAFVRMPWSFDLEWIAEVYLDYQKTMGLWRSLLPEQRIIDIGYEDLINDPEPIAQALLASCGLDWDPACLKFFEAKRSVQTASFWQVRQPMYKTSQQRWKNYGPYLGDLVRRIRDHIPESDDELRAAGVPLQNKKRWLAW